MTPDEFRKQDRTMPQYFIFWELSWRGKLKWLRGQRFRKPTQAALAGHAIRLMKAKTLADDRGLIEGSDVIEISKPKRYTSKPTSR